MCVQIFRVVRRLRLYAPSDPRHCALWRDLSGGVDDDMEAQRDSPTELVGKNDRFVTVGIHETQCEGGDVPIVQEM